MSRYVVITQRGALLSFWGTALRVATLLLGLLFVQLAILPAMVVGCYVGWCCWYCAQLVILSVGQYGDVIWFGTCALLGVYYLAMTRITLRERRCAGRYFITWSYLSGGICSYSGSGVTPSWCFIIWFSLLNACSGLLILSHACVAAFGIRKAADCVWLFLETRRRIGMVSDCF